MRRLDAGPDPELVSWLFASLLQKNGAAYGI